MAGLLAAQDVPFLQSVAVVAISIVMGAIIAVLDLVLQYAIDFLVK